MDPNGAQIIQLKGDQETLDPRLDRVEQFDERSRGYNVAELFGSTEQALRSYTWRCEPVLDQGREGACVGFAWSHEMAARPKVVKGIDNTTAQALYKRAQQLDPWPGESYSGTSVLAGVKAAQEQGHFSEYRWAFNLHDLALAVGRKGPAVLGIPWFDSMYSTEHVVDGRHRVVVGGTKVGGHAILCNGFNKKRREFRLHNSWGEGWGQKGGAWIEWDSLQALMAMGGEACIPVIR